MAEFIELTKQEFVDLHIEKYMGKHGVVRYYDDSGNYVNIKVSDSFNNIPNEEFTFNFSDSEKYYDRIYDVYYTITDVNSDIIVENKSNVRVYQNKGNVVYSNCIFNSTWIKLLNCEKCIIYMIDKNFMFDRDDNEKSHIGDNLLIEGEEIW